MTAKNTDTRVTVMESDTSVTVQCKLWSDLNVTVSYGVTLV